MRAQDQRRMDIMAQKQEAFQDWSPVGSGFKTRVGLRQKMGFGGKHVFLWLCWGVLILAQLELGIQPTFLNCDELLVGGCIPKLCSTRSLCANGKMQEIWRSNREHPRDSWQQFSNLTWRSCGEGNIPNSGPPSSQEPGFKVKTIQIDLFFGVEMQEATTSVRNQHFEQKRRDDFEKKQQDEASREEKGRVWSHKYWLIWSDLYLVVNVYEIHTCNSIRP